MADGPWHYRRAEELLAIADERLENGDPRWTSYYRDSLVAEAEAHAHLAEIAERAEKHLQMKEYEEISRKWRDLLTTPQEGSS